MAVAFLISLLGTCSRRRVGCVLLSYRGHVLATGYNGPPAGAQHCIDSPCAGADSPSGTNLDACRAIHAEQNAIAQCRNTSEITTVYCTDSPCLSCVKQLSTTSAYRVVFWRAYPHPSEAYWRDLGREWVHLPTLLQETALTAPMTVCRLVIDLVLGIGK